MTQILKKEEDSYSNQNRFWNNSTRKKWMIAIFLGSAALYSSRIVMPINNYQLIKEFKWNQKTSGKIMGSFFCGYMITQMIGGYLGDKYGGEKVLTYAGFLSNLMTILFACVPSLFSSHTSVLVGFIVCRVLMGVFQGFHFPSVCSLMAVRVVDTSRQFTYSFMHSGSHAGTLFCGSVGAYIMDNYGWRKSFICMGSMGIVWSLSVYYNLLKFPAAKQVGLDEDRSIKTQPSPGHVLKLTATPSQAYLIDNDHSNIKSDCIGRPVTKSVRLNLNIPWVTLFTSTAFWAMIFGHFTHNNAIFIIINWLPSYFHNNYPSAKSWVFNVVPYLINIPSTLLSGVIADYLVLKGFSITFVRKAMTTIVLLGGGWCLIFLAHVNNYYAALFWMAMALCVNGFHSSGILLNPQDLDPQHGGSIYGIMSMVGAIPGFAGVYLVGYVLDITGSWALVFQSTGGFCIIGWAVYMIFGTGHQII